MPDGGKDGGKNDMLKKHGSRHSEIVATTTKIITTAFAPGYRDCTITVEITDNGKPRRLQLILDRQESTDLAGELARMQSLAWHGHRPLDARDHETTRPVWVKERD